VKFLCEHCKAKYQIADDKVAGRTVRMKCRKCGGAIEVRAAVTETSVSMKAADVAPSEAPHGPASAPPHAPPRPPPPRPSALSKSLAQPARPASPPSRSAPPKDGPLAGAFQRNVHRDEDATAAGLDLRELSAADEWYVAVNGVPVGPVRIGEVRRKAAIGAVTEESLCWQEGMEEWRPIRTVTELAAVVREAASGGRSSQLPPDPYAPHAVAGSRPSPPVRPSGSHGVPTPSRAPSAPAWSPRGAAPSPVSLRQQDNDDDGGATLVGRSPLLEAEAAEAQAALAGGPAAGMHPEPFKPHAVDPFKPHAADPFRPPEPAPNGGGLAPLAASHAPFAPAQAPFAPPVGQAPFGAPVGQAPFAPQAPIAQAQGPFAPPPPVLVAGPRRFSPMAIGVIVMFGTFGAMAAFMLLSKPPQPIVINAPPAPVAQVAPTATAAPAPTDVPAAPVAEAPSAAPAPVDAGVKVAAVTRPAAGGTAAAATAKPGGAAAIDPALRELLGSNPTGPSAGPGQTGGGGGAQLSEAETQQVVQQHSLAVRRTCWDRTTSSTPSVKVTVNVKISGSGQVTSATATGNDPVVGHCLEQEIRLWHWPGGGEVNVPFHFLRQ